MLIYIIYMSQTAKPNWLAFLSGNPWLPWGCHRLIFFFKIRKLGGRILKVFNKFHGQRRVLQLFDDNNNCSMRRFSVCSGMKL